MIEREMKVMLTKKEHDVIVRRCGGLVFEPQSNYYFDTENLSMNEKGVTYRIRAKYGKYKATIKHHFAAGCSAESELCQQDEFNPKIFACFGVDYKGVLETYRAVIYKDCFCEMVLDRNAYLKHTDFELEVEFCDEGEWKAMVLLQEIAKLLAQEKVINNIEEFMTRINQGKSKSERFFERFVNQ